MLKLAITVSINLYFQTFRPYWLNFFWSFQNHFGLRPKNNRLESICLWNIHPQRTHLPLNMDSVVFQKRVDDFPVEEAANAMEGGSVAVVTDGGSGSCQGVLWLPGW